MPTATKPTEQPAIDRDTINRLYAMYGLPVIGGGSQENDADAADEQDEEGDLPADLGDKGKAALADERKAKRDAQKALKAAQAELDAMKADKAAADEAKRAADEKAAEEQGQYKTLAETRATELAAAKAANTETQAKLDALIASLKPGIDAAWKELPEEVEELFTGDAEDVLAKQAFMAAHKKLIDRFAAEKNDKDEAYRRVPKTPQPNGNGLTADGDKARRAQGRTVSTI